MPSLPPVPEAPSVVARLEALADATPLLHLPPNPRGELRRVVDDAHALATVLYAEATFALQAGFEAEAQRIYARGEQAFAIGLRTELALEQLTEGIGGERAHDRS